MAALVGVILLSVNRTQALIGDLSFMKSMIPHHSIANQQREKSEHQRPACSQAGGRNHRVSGPRNHGETLLIDDIARHGERSETELPARSAEVTPGMQSKIREAVQ